MSAFNSIPIFYFSRKCLFNGPSISDSPCKDSFFEAKLFSPRRYVFGDTFKCNIDICSYIGLLSFRIRPLAVFFAVTECAINSIYGFFCRPLTHITKKIFEGFSPSRTYGNPFCPIHIVFCVPFPMASTNHVLVSNICPALYPIYRMPMYRLAGLCRASTIAIQRFTYRNLMWLGFKMPFAVLANSINIIGKVFHELIIQCKAKVAGFFVALPGLTKRRQIESDLCLRGIP